MELSKKKIPRLTKPKLPNYDPNELEGILVNARGGDKEAVAEILKRFEKPIEGFYTILRKGNYNIRARGQVYFLSLFTKEKTKYKSICQVIKNQLRDLPNEELYQMIRCSVLIAIQEWETNFFLTISVKLKGFVEDYLDDQFRKNEINITELHPVASDFTIENHLMEEMENSIDIPKDRMKMKALRHKTYNTLLG